MAGGGAKPGERRGGRKKGKLNRLTEVTRQSALEGVQMAKRTKRTPLEFLLGVGNGVITDYQPDQFSAMVAAAPYCHARLAAVAYVPPPDDTQNRRREMLRQLSYQQRKAIEGILLAGDAEIDGAVVPEDETPTEDGK